VKHTVKPSLTVVAFGDGLISACEAKAAEFDVNTKGQRGELDVHVDGRPSLHLLQFHTMPPCSALTFAPQSLFCCMLLCLIFVMRRRLVHR